MVLENGCFADLGPVAGRAGSPCLLLDRDGVVVEDTDYLRRVEDVRLVPGAATVLATARRMGYVCGLVTNQSGIGRGYFGWDDFIAVQREIASRLASEGAGLDFVLACPYHERAAVPRYRMARHPWRKPSPGMLEAALRHFASAASGSMMIGDRLSDLEAGMAAGVGRLVHVLTGHGNKERGAVAAWAAESAEAVELVDSIADVMSLLL